METLTKYEFIHPDIHKSQAEQCFLLIEVSKLRLTCALYNREYSQVLMLKSEFFQEESAIPAIIQAVLSSLPFDASTLAGCKLAFYTRIFDLVPNEWLIPDERHHYLILHQPDIRYEQTMVNHISSLQLSLISEIPSWMEVVRKDIPNSFDVVHGGVLFIENRLLAPLKTKQEPSVHLHFLPDGIEVLILAQKKLIYYTYFESNSAEELLYLVLNALHTLGYTEPGKVFISGLSTAQNYFDDVLSDYFKRIKFVRYQPEFSAKFLKKIKNIPEGEFELLFQLLLCA